MLQRVIRHFKSHNWMVAAIDFLIVVLGVFIGIQASSWNDQRQDDKRADQALAALQQEFAGIDNAAKSLAGFYEKSLRNQTILLQALETGKADPRQQDVLKDAVALGLVYGDPPPPAGSFRDLLSSGNLNLIRDKQLRLKLIEYDQSLAIISTSDTNIQIGVSAFYPAYVRHMVINVKAGLPDFKDDNFFVDADFSNVTVDFKAALSDPEFRVAAGQAYLAQKYRLINVKLCQSKIATIRSLLAKRLKEGQS